MAKYDDSSEKDVSDSVTWSVVGHPTIASVSALGLITPKTKGYTELTASKEGITSDVISVTVCGLEGFCIDTLDTGSGKLFTSSPSKAYLDSIGGSANNGTFTETGTYGPNGEFYTFTWSNANALCGTYNTSRLGGRTNWRLATKDELEGELYNIYGNMFSALGWPTFNPYWSATPASVSGYTSVDLSNGDVGSFSPGSSLYPSCVSP